MNILLENGRIVDPVNGLDRKGNLLISNGKIAAVDPDPVSLLSEAKKLIFLAKS